MRNRVKKRRLRGLHDWVQHRPFRITPHTSIAVVYPTISANEILKTVFSQTVCIVRYLTLVVVFNVYSVNL